MASHGGIGLHYLVGMGVKQAYATQEDTCFYTAIQQTGYQPQL